jgi:hypothetical protein
MRAAEIYRVELDILDDGQVTIIENDAAVGPSKLRVAKNNGGRQILVDDVDISRWVYGYDRVVTVGEIDRWRLHLHADREVLSVNGTHPWEEVQETVGG